MSAPSFRALSNNARQQLLKHMWDAVVSVTGMDLDDERTCIIGVSSKDPLVSRVLDVHVPDGRARRLGSNSQSIGFPQVLREYGLSYFLFYPDNTEQELVYASSFRIRSSAQKQRRVALARILYLGWLQHKYPQVMKSRLDDQCPGHAWHRHFVTATEFQAFAEPILDAC